MAFAATHSGPSAALVGRYSENWHMLPMKTNIWYLEGSADVTWVIEPHVIPAAIPMNTRKLPMRSMLPCIAGILPSPVRHSLREILPVRYTPCRVSWNWKPSNASRFV